MDLDNELAAQLRIAVEELKHPQDRTLERKYASDVLLAPDVVTIEGDVLRWAFDRKVNEAEERKALQLTHSRIGAARLIRGARQVPPGTGLLDGFAKLGDAPPGRIGDFALRQGVLGICEHGLPCSHALECTPLGWDGQGGWEQLARWRYYARRARSLLIIASRLHGQFRQTGAGELAPCTKEELEPLKRELAKVLLAAGRLGPRPRLVPHDWWQMIADVVNEWLAIGEVRPRLLPTETTVPGPPKLVLAPQWRVHGPEFPLFGQLGMQLALAVTKERGRVYCVSCGEPFDPSTRRQKYCKTCGRAAALRDAARRYRADLRRKAEAKTEARRLRERARKARR